MITLYHCYDARSLRCLWLLEELGLPCDLRMLPFPPQVRAPEFLQIHPLGTVPYLIDGSLKMSESVAILTYLAEQHSPADLAVAPGMPGRADWLEWMYFGEASLTQSLAVWLRYAVLLPSERRVPAVAADYREMFLARVGRLAEHLKTCEHVAAGRFTTADISVGYALMLGRVAGLHDAYPAAVQAYWSRLAERPAYRQARARQKAALLSLEEPSA